MPESAREKARRLEERRDVRQALQQTASHKPPRKIARRTVDVVGFWIYVLLLLGFGFLFYLFRFSAFGLDEQFRILAQRFTVGAMLIVLILGLAKTAKIYFVDQVEDEAHRFNLRRVLRLVVVIAIALIVISILFANWYTAAVTLGLLSLILGAALQTPITSLIGWVYIVARSPYEVGDRIRIGEVTGDVIDVNYLDTTVWEFGGEYLSSDQPSGRLVKFPNSKVLDSAVYNYTWPLFPYIWNEVKFQVAYGSDLEFVAKTMREVATEELGAEMEHWVETYRELLAQTPVDEVTVQEHPVLLIRVHDNTWVEAIIRYLVDPKKAGSTKTALIRKMLARLNEAPDRVMFPKGDSR